MSAAPTKDGTTSVSLLEHLHAILFPLLTLAGVPPILRDELAVYVKPQLADCAQEIPYDVLLRVSRWANTSEAKLALKDASLDPSDYMMISLLAGSITSPKAILGAYTPPPTALETRRAAVRDRRAVIALINALFSIIGVGVAVWRASNTTGWVPGLRMAWAVFAGFVVAVAEGGLYLIWNNRASAQKKFLKGGNKKVEPPIVALTIPQAILDTGADGEDAPDGLRRRTAAYALDETSS